MTITIDGPTFRRVFEEIAASKIPDAREVTAIVQLVDVVAGANLDEDPAERTLLESLIQFLTDLAGVSARSIPRLARLPGDSEERRPLCITLANELGGDDLRALAFASAYLLVIADYELAPVEVEALADVQNALGISDERATDLALAVAEIVTPGVTWTEPLHAV